MMQQMFLGQSPGLTIEDVFSVDTYTGNGTSQTITNGIDLAGDGGLVWIKNRDVTQSHILTDSEKPLNNYLYSDTNQSQFNNFNAVTAFNSDGFDVGGSLLVNDLSNGHVAWTFRKSRKFFDVVTYSGNSTAGRTISHNLDAVPGMIWIKCLNSSLNWRIYHTYLGNTKSRPLNNTDAPITSSGYWNNTTPTSSVFTLGSDNDVNVTGNDYVAYLFAEDTSDKIKCGGYIGNGTASNTITTGFETQFLFVNLSDNGNNDYHVYDTTRGMIASSSHRLEANTSDIEVDTSANNFYSTSTGFVANNRYNVADWTYLYMAIAAP